MIKKIVITCALVCLTVDQVNAFGKNKVNYQQFNWKIIKTLHFEIHYPEGMDELGIIASTIVNNSYPHIANYLKHELNVVIPIIIFPSKISFYNNNIIPNILGEGTGGFTESLKNRIVVPFNGSYDELRHVLVHEMVHAFQYNILFADTTGNTMYKLSVNRLPLWFMEGMAEYISIGYDETADMFMRDILFNEQFINLKKLTLLQVPNIYYVYKEGQSFFYFIEQNYGKDIIGEMLRDLRDLRDLNQVILHNTGKKFDKIDKEWRRFYKKKYYPLLKDKKFDDNEGTRITHQIKNRVSVNLHPAISPDGQKIAYFTNKDIYSTLVVARIKNKKQKRIKTLITGSNRAKFESMHFMANTLSWTHDSKNLVFVARSYGKDIVFFIDPDDGSIKKQLEFPFRCILDPAISHDGELLVFVGITGGSCDIYTYNITTKQLNRVTNNRFSERYPKIAPDKAFIIYSSNFNKKNDISSNSYNLYIYNIKNDKNELLLSTGGNDIQADIRNDNKKIVFASNKSGIYNIYTYDLKSKKTDKITNVISGSFYPNWHPDGKSIAYVSYQNFDYNIHLKDINRAYDDSLYNETLRYNVNYNYPGYINSQYYIDEYKTALSPDYVLFGVTGASNYAIVGFAQMALSDYFGDHRVILTSNYTRYDDENNANFDIAYYYLKQRFDIGFGVFRQKNPFWIYSLTDLNDLIHNAYTDTTYLEHYGGYSVISYPFSKFFKCSTKISVSRYDHEYTEESDRDDIHANLNRVTVALSYDNILWGPMVPFDGFRGKLSAQQALNVTGSDYSYTSLDLDLRKYFLMGDMYVFALRAMGGKIFNNDNNSFNYYLGGYNTLRGYSFLSIEGSNMFMLNAEFRFIALEHLKLGFPLFLSINQLGGVLFIDLGSAWNDNYSMYDSKNNQLDDLKADMGFGFRLSLYPVIILKLDFAWAYNLQSFGNRQLLFSMGFEF